MLIRQLLETSGNDWQGSLTPDLMASKIWLCDELKAHDRKRFSTIYILGSWYGNMGFVLKRCGIKFQKIINVDKDRARIDFTEKLYKKLNIRSDNVWADANTIDFSEADGRSLIICTSPQDIIYTRWFDSIPKGPLIAIQSRNNAELDNDSLVDFDSQFPMRQVLIVDERTYNDPETEYQRYMKIGIK